MFISTSVQRAVGERFANCAAWFALMFAVAEVTACRNRFHVRERVTQRAADVPQLKLSHSRRVDQQSPALQNYQLAMSRRMTPAAVVLAHLGGLLKLLSNDPIEQRRLADAR